MSARVIRPSASRMASFTKSQRPLTAHNPFTSQGEAAPSTQAVRAIGPSMAVITSAMAI